ncbi:hypothetical protein P8891_14965 [Bacillus atrophaeus]|uniref:hypothetical protein n=1 Tax=Bacillus atrophaeus TaxID=1452 RepID=UPI00227E14EA|nr:hypothetical protein [Bacillus atrophaeus]MCY7945945.1 hypothetical protein [Bacillus atrophaeus]MCY8096944.1 hypothetical protein [Bacillus atrophaeus]MCY9168391.1 hypothetical protein [Bacillus atrophaeus]MEC0742331.1 hypothetical protein [Bacillus atrophaeus]MEC0744355.1 hypothetical protein [Bacillus atrophaeus]
MEEKKLLIAADALVKTGGALHRPVGEATLDMDQALPSLGKFLAYDISPVVCYHGGVFQGRPHQRIKRAARKNRDVNTPLLFYEE